MNAEQIRELLDKARRSLRTAEHIMEDGDYDFAVSRAYYAMFYTAQALLLTRGVRRAKHSGVLAAFNREFIRTGELPRDLFVYLRQGFGDRAEGDYDLTRISEERARNGLATAREFVEVVGRAVSRRLDTDA